MTDLALPNTGQWPELAAPPHRAVHAGIAGRMLRYAVNGLDVTVRFPDGTTMGDGTHVFEVHRPNDFLNRIGQHRLTGFGEAYMAGDWGPGPDTDLADLLAPFAQRMDRLVPAWAQRMRRLVDRPIPAEEENSVEGARNNISRHYDLSNDLFAGFLDETMTYSGAWFEDPHEAVPESLSEAQQRKMEGILDFAGVRDGSRVLEIGTGWGALAIAAARRGAQVTSITISQEQADLARRRVQRAGLSDLVSVELRDYREQTGEFDAIVSVEMIEAVGEQYWPTYFATMDRLLVPGGRIGLQAITMAHDRLEATRRSHGWIHKYIFPGGLIPSLHAIDGTLEEHTGLRAGRSRGLGPDYARTLRIWRETFLSRWDEISRQGFDETFRRMWEFYLAYCEAGFRVGYLNVFQLELHRPS